MRKNEALFFFTRPTLNKRKHLRERIFFFCMIFSAYPIYCLTNPFSRIFLICLFVCLFVLLFRAEPSAYGGSQARGPIGTAAASLHHSYSNARCQVQAKSVTYTTAHSNA